MRNFYKAAGQIETKLITGLNFYQKSMLKCHDSFKTRLKMSCSPGQGGEIIILQQPHFLRC
jgi:hypothetical protein